MFIIETTSVRQAVSRKLWSIFVVYILHFNYDDDDDSLVKPQAGLRIFTSFSLVMAFLIDLVQISTYQKNLKNYLVFQGPLIHLILP